jgi:hypothetical protein
MNDDSEVGRRKRGLGGEEKPNGGSKPKTDEHERAERDASTSRASAGDEDDRAGKAAQAKCQQGREDGRRGPD